MIKAYNTQTGRYQDMGMPLDRADFKKWFADNSEFTHVEIPMSWWGYGASLITLANCEVLERHYKRRIQKADYQHAWFFTRSQITRNDDLVELVCGLAYDYPLLDDEIHSRMETEVLAEHVRDAMADELPDQDVADIADWVLDHAEEWADYETCYLDNDGVTPYMSKDSLARLVGLYVASL